MSHRYLPHTPGDVRQQLAVTGAASVNDLFDAIPPQLRLKDGRYALEDGMSETEVREYFEQRMSQITPLVCFAGNGWYDRYSPAVTASIAARSELLTAYTPYQPEISQGTLQYIFEYQSMICTLTGLDVANASLYDGSTATAEAMLMMAAAGRRGKNAVLVSETLNPAVRSVVDTYARYHKVPVRTIPQANGVTDRSAMQQMLDQGDVAGVIVASPNRHGIVEDLSGWADDIHAAKALLAVNTHAIALGVLRSPASWGADIAVGEAQSLGMPMNYGGPGLGYMAVTKALMRKMPGRIVGATTDALGQRVFVLTLQAREQHIRREKATSNICSNQGIMTLHAAIYLSLMGPEGLREANMQSHAAAVYMAQRLQEKGIAPAYPGQPFLNEFVITVPNVDAILDNARAQGILAGVKTGNDKLMIALTEMRTKEQIDSLINIIATTGNE